MYMFMFTYNDKIRLPIHVHVFVLTLSLLGAIASNSSIKIMAGAFFSASSKAAYTDN